MTVMTKQDLEQAIALQLGEKVFQAFKDANQSLLTILNHAALDAYMNGAKDWSVDFFCKHALKQLATNGYFTFTTDEEVEAQAREDAEWDRKRDIVDKINEENSFASTWSIFDMFNGEQDFAKVVHPNGIRVVYKNNWGDVVETTQEGQVTLLDMWKIADDLIRRSGDGHHIFIEGFMDKGDHFELSTGS